MKEAQKEKRQNPHKYWILALHTRAADGNRTRDLRLTKATLYRLSHSSIFVCFQRSALSTNVSIA